MRIRSVTVNNRRRAFELRIATGVLPFPFSKCEPTPHPSDPVQDVLVDPELGREAFTYRLRSGKEGSIHLDEVLEYNQDPTYLRDALLYQLTIEARKQVDASPLAKREIIRRLGTSAAQFYRLLDQTNYRKTVDQLLKLLHVLECNVDLVVRPKPGRRAA